MRLILLAFAFLGSPDAASPASQMFCEYDDGACWREGAQLLIQERDRYRDEAAVLRTRLKNVQRGAAFYLDRAIRCEFAINSMAETLGFKKRGAK
jgi:hypothetical protein